MTEATGRCGSAAAQHNPNGHEDLKAMKAVGEKVLGCVNWYLTSPRI